MSGAWAQERVALLIGNANYVAVPPLANPLNDVSDMKLALEDLGFRVFTGEDLTRVEMTAMIDRFGDAAETSEVALFYYAGHAFQVDGNNYLVPVDIAPTTQANTLEGAVPFDLVMGALRRAPNLRLVFLDSCRDNPLGLTSQNRAGGLAPVGNSDNFFIAYATEPGAVAYDGDGRNGTFTEAVLSHIHTPGQTISEMMISVRLDVMAVTGGQQVPWDNSSLTQVFRFNEAARGASEETMLFQVASRVQDQALMSYYLQRYPQGAHVGDATDFILGARSTSLSDGIASQQDEDASGTILWELAQRTRQRRLVEFYLMLFPNGRHVSEAERMLETLPSEQDLGAGQLCERLATHPRDATSLNAGVSFAALQSNHARAILACQEAVQRFPEQPRFLALLARATLASGQGGLAVQHYRDAAEAGDLRALVTLGILHETGNGVPQDQLLALSYFERAAAGGSPEAMINVAVSLFEGANADQDVERAIALFRRASALGAAEATFNLGVLAQRGLTATIEDAYGFFVRAAREGEPEGYRAAAILLDRGFGVERDHANAASLLLRGAAEDRGRVIDEFRTNGFDWSPQTVRALQSSLSDVGLYMMPIDGEIREDLVRALENWRSGGFDAGVLSN